MSIRIKIRQDILYMLKDIFKECIDKTESEEGKDLAYKLTQQCNYELSKIEDKRRSDFTSAVS